MKKILNRISNFLKSDRNYFIFGVILCFFSIFNGINNMRIKNEVKKYKHIYFNNGFNYAADTFKNIMKIHQLKDTVKNKIFTSKIIFSDTECYYLQRKY